MLRMESVGANPTEPGGLYIYVVAAQPEYDCFLSALRSALRSALFGFENFRGQKEKRLFTYLLRARKSSLNVRDSLSLEFCAVGSERSEPEEAASCGIILQIHLELL